MSASTTNERLKAWVSEWEAVLQPDSVHWCDGSAEEYETLAQQLVDAGTFEKLSDEVMQADLDLKLFAAIRSCSPINCGDYMARSTLMGIMGRMATYTGQMVYWDTEAAKKAGVKDLDKVVIAIEIPMGAAVAAP